jgi:hypothetical protein
MNQDHTKVVFIIGGVVIVLALIWLFIPNDRKDITPIQNSVGVVQITQEQKESLLQDLTRLNKQVVITQKQKEELLKKLIK